MLSADEARALILETAKPAAAERVALDDAQGRVLAESVSARRDQPPFASSAMDGYALRAADAPGKLRVAGESAAGRPFVEALTPGVAVRISTGAAVPDGADTVLIQEDAEIDGATLVAPEINSGANIRARGGDFREGQTLLPAGRRLAPGDVMLAAAAGFAELSVAARPRIALLASGDELVSPGARAQDAQIYDSASIGVAALARAWGADVTRLPLLPDDPNQIGDAAYEALPQFDMLVLIGGASVGPHDHSRAALPKLEMLIEKVAMKPGKPLWFARARHGLVLGFPGNPASALVCARLFLVPWLAASMGADDAMAWRRAPLGDSLPANGPREHYARGSCDAQGALHATSDQDSSLVSMLSRSTLLIRQAPREAARRAGDEAPFLAWQPNAL